MKVATSTATISTISLTAATLAGEEGSLAAPAATPKIEPARETTAFNLIERLAVEGGKKAFAENDM